MSGCHANEVGLHLWCWGVLNNRMTQSDLKIIQKYANSHPSISPRWAQQMSPCSFPERAIDLPMVAQQVEEGSELRSSHSQFCLLFLRLCFLGFSHSDLFPTQSTSLCSLLLRLFGSPTGLIPAGSRNTAALRYEIPQGVPGDWTLPALSWDATVSPEHHQSSLLSAPSCLFLWSQSRPPLAHVMPYTLRKQHPFLEKLTASCLRIVIIHDFV